jgi:hypothetical protein
MLAVVVAFLVLAASEPEETPARATSRVDVATEAHTT